MKTRHRFQQSFSLRDRLTSFAVNACEKASRLPPGIEKDDLLKKARQADTAAHLEDWVNSPGLRPPK